MIETVTKYGDSSKKNEKGVERVEPREMIRVETDTGACIIFTFEDLRNNGPKRTQFRSQIIP